MNYDTKDCADDFEGIRCDLFDIGRRVRLCVSDPPVGDEEGNPIYQPCLDVDNGTVIAHVSRPSGMCVTVQEDITGNQVTMPQETLWARCAKLPQP